MKVNCLCIKIFIIPFKCKGNTRDGSAGKPVLVQDTECMVEKTYQKAQYLGALGAHLIPHLPIYGSK